MRGNEEDGGMKKGLLFSILTLICLIPFLSYAVPVEWGYERFDATRNATLIMTAANVEAGYKVFDETNNRTKIYLDPDVVGGSASVSDTVYGSSWNGVTTIAPSKNAVYDKIEGLALGADYVAKALYDAYTILYADSDNTPAALTIGASTIVGRKASGGIVALTGAEVLTIIGAGVGTVTGVGDCTSGACLDGTSDGGTYISLYDGNSNWTKIVAGDSIVDLTFTTPTAYPAGTYFLTSTTAGALGYVNPATYAPLASPTFTGVVTVPIGTETLPGLTGADADTGIDIGSNGIYASVAGARVFGIEYGGAGIVHGYSYPLSFLNGPAGSSTPDLFLRRISAGVAQLDNAAATGTTLRITGSTDGVPTNYFWGTITSTYVVGSANQLVITGARAGTAHPDVDIVLTPIGAGVVNLKSILTVSSSSVTTSVGLEGLASILTNGATADVTAAQMRGQTHRVTGAYTLSLPTAAGGLKGRFIATTAAVMALDLVTGTNIIILNGTALAAGNKVVTDGTINATLYVESDADGYYRVNSIIGVASDGGA